MSQTIAINYQRLTLTPTEQDTATQNQNIASLIECYRETFATKPWSEWLCCPKCDSSWGKEDSPIVIAKNYKCCDTPMQDYWPRDKVFADIKNEITDTTSCWIALNSKEVVGFGWAYPITLETLEDKLSIKIGSFKNKKQLAVYQDEIGVSAEYRNKKIASSLFNLAQKDLCDCGAVWQFARVRAEPTPSISYQWFIQKLGYGVVARYPKRDGRVVLGRMIPKPN